MPNEHDLEPQEESTIANDDHLTDAKMSFRGDEQDEELDDRMSDEEEEELEDDTDLEDDELDEDQEDEADQQYEPLSDLKELIITDPERALERTAQVEAGLVKLQVQKHQAESFVSGIDTVFQGLERGDPTAVSQFEQVLYDNTGLTYQSLADMQTGDSSGYENAKLANLERKLEALENERAASQWVTEVGSVVASQVARETGLEFSPEQLWMARPYLHRGATVEDVRKAVMRVDPDAYDRAVARRDGTKSPVPRSATLPTGRGGTHRTFEHTAQGFLKAYEAKRARGG
jgi:hypothetical protein